MMFLHKEQKAFSVLSVPKLGGSVVQKNTSTYAVSLDRQGD